VEGYAKDRGLDGWNRKVFHYLIRIMDNAYLQRVRDQEKTAPGPRA